MSAPLSPYLKSSYASPLPNVHERAKRYRVFLSYSHADTKWARWLMRRIELYTVPKRLRGRDAPIGEVGRRIAPVFRDRDELPTTSDLGETIRAALRESATLVVICSQTSARSRWVQEEITAFKRLHGERGVFAFIVSGEPKVAGAADDCFSPALRAEVGADGELSGVPAEVVAADARPHSDGPKLAFVRLLAGLLGVGFDELRQRELQRRNRRLTLISVCSVAGMALTLGLAAVAWQARNEAVLARNDAKRRQDQAEELHAFMLGDVRKEVEKVGRLDALEAVFNASVAYFNSLNERDLTDTALARQAKALTQVGEVRMKQARYADAQRAFATAYIRAKALAERHPQNADMLFERAQAEYYLGFVHLRRGQRDETAPWFIRYRDSALALARLEPGTVRSEREIAAGYHNLAVLEKDRGNVAAARSAFQTELDTVTKLAAADPQDSTHKFRIADVNSWLGSIAEQNGDLAQAVERFAAEVAQLEALCAAEPKTAKWSYRLCDGLCKYATVATVTGQRELAVGVLARARAIIDLLTAQDPKNRDWVLLAAMIRIKQAELALAAKRPEVGRDDLVMARESVEKIRSAEPTRVAFGQCLATAWKAEAWYRHFLGKSDALAAALTACEIIDSAAVGKEPEAGTLGLVAGIRIVAGAIAEASGDGDAARKHRARALEVLGPRLGVTNNWRVLDPAARALAFLGRQEEAREIVHRLSRFGYQPLEPWPGALKVSVQHNNP